ncbi:MAG: hypothetical protein AAF098_17810 [Pseudomonadota bacterium]
MPPSKHSIGKMNGPKLALDTKLFRAAAISCVLFLSACASLSDRTASNWPDNLPPSQHFLDAYQGDEENAEIQSQKTYLYWVRSFYEGTFLYPIGWNQITEDILAETEGEQRLEARKQTLFDLGQDIATEWAKDTKVNLVENAHLAVWSVAATRAVEEDNVDETLARIQQDVESLMLLELSAEDITADRYHPQDPDDWFAF